MKQSAISRWQDRPRNIYHAFSVCTSTNLSSIIQGSVGEISYGLMKYRLDHKVQVPVYVSRVTDINIPPLMVCTHQSQKKQVGWGSFASKVEFSASVNHTGFCVGHNLPFTVTVDNGSSQRIKMKASIFRDAALITLKVAPILISESLQLSSVQTSLLTLSLCGV